MPDEKRPVLNHLVEALRDLNNLAQRECIPATVIDGVAASLIGRPRMTKDIDLLVHLDEQLWPSFLRAAERAGFVAQVSDPLPFARQSRVLLLRHAASGIDVDLTFGATAFEDEVIRRSSVANLLDISIPLPTPEDLIVLKWLAHRDQDLLDVHGILDSRPDVDIADVRTALSEFTEYVDDFDLVTEFDTMLARRNKTR